MTETPNEREEREDLRLEVNEWQDAWSEVRDAILNGRGQLAEMDIDNDVTNAILGILDDAMPAAGPKEGEPNHEVQH